MCMRHFYLVDWEDSEDMEDEKEMNAMDDEEDDEEKEEDEDEEEDENARKVVEEEITLPLSQWLSATECDDPSPRS